MEIRLFELKNGINNTAKNEYEEVMNGIIQVQHAVNFFTGVTCLCIGSDS